MKDKIQRILFATLVWGYMIAAIGLLVRVFIHIT